MNEYIIKNWRTTLIGLVLSVSGFILFTPENFGGHDATIVQLSKYILAGGFAGLGIVSSDIKK